ncbi:glycosyltransferase family 2 protein [Pedobacter panaciterrae]|uniref:glycosyltransferase family 2 protein n=1 Tax=Pedobacter panaciterrae TaxID=363849 RepID=UPI002594A826|nr:glycosyltransferase [uncultured Pedobacter sp.]
MSKISIIIVTYNSEALIDDCLASIFKYNDIDKGIEIIIVDNMSKNVDSMFASIKEKFGDEILLIKNDKNGGYGQGNNVGIRIATAPLIMIMNPDVRIDSKIFDRVYRSFKDERVIMVGFQQFLSDVKRGYSFFTKKSSIANLFLDKIFFLLNIYFQKYMCFTGACFFVRKSAFERIGMFDENIFLYGEEVDIHNRLQTSFPEGKMIYDKSIRYIHLIGNRIHKEEEALRQFKSFIYLCKKNHLDIVKECNMRIGYYKALRFKDKVLNKDVAVLNNTIKMINDYLRDYKVEGNG